MVQTSQAVRGIDQSSDQSGPKPRKMGTIDTVLQILRKDGLAAFWRGIGPALVLVMNPVIQYTVFEQLKNTLIRRRTARLRASGAVSSAIAVLSDVDYFILGALSKLGEMTS